MTLTAVQELDDRPRVRLNVSTTLGGSAWVSLWRTHEDGSRYRVIVDRNARLAGGAWVGYDYHAPLAGHAVAYEAVTASESATVADVWLDGVVPWLVHATDPTLSMPIEYVPEDGFGDDDYASKAGVFEIVGSDRPATVWDDTVTVTSSARLGFLAEQAPAAQKLLQSGGPLLLNLPAGWDVDWRWLQAKSVRLERNAGRVADGGKAGYPYRYLSFSYTWIRQPNVQLAPEWTYDDLPGAFVSLNALEASYAHLDDLITDTRV